MSVVVRMEMPKRCYDCDMADGVTCMATGGVYGREVPKMIWIRRRPEWCPIICSIPEGHGRLVDADAMAKDLEYDCELDAIGLDDMTIVGHEREHLQFDKDCKQNCMWYLTEQETIVPAEAERSET